MSDESEIEILYHWPGGWPGRSAVEMDNLGDPGFWLEDRLESIREGLRGDDAAIREVASMLADDYIIAAAEMGFPIPSDFEASDEECREMIEGEFNAFLLEWQRRIGATRQT